MDRLYLMTVFAAVAEEESFAGGARRLCGEARLGHLNLAAGLIALAAAHDRNHVDKGSHCPLLHRLNASGPFLFPSLRRRYLGYARRTPI